LLNRKKLIKKSTEGQSAAGICRRGLCCTGQYARYANIVRIRLLQMEGQEEKKPDLELAK